MKLLTVLCIGPIKLNLVPLEPSIRMLNYLGEDNTPPPYTGVTGVYNNTFAFLLIRNDHLKLVKLF